MQNIYTDSLRNTATRMLELAERMDYKGVECTPEEKGLIRLSCVEMVKGMQEEMLLTFIAGKNPMQGDVAVRFDQMMHDLTESK